MFFGKNLYCRLIFLCFIFYSLPLLASYEEFYVFDVGQGNSQFAAYKKSGIGVLYDCGSSSSQVHPKINQLKSDEEWHTFFKRRVDKPKIIEKKQLDFDDVLEDKNSLSSESISLKESSAVKTNKFIKEIIEKCDLQHLFIILSHPDKDHINFINEQTIPYILPVTAFLEGDWLGVGGSNSKKTKLSKDVTAVLTFLKERENTWVEFPYYWSGIKKIESILSYKDIRNELRKVNGNIYELCSNGTVSNEAFYYYFNLYESLSHVKQLYYNSDEEKEFELHINPLSKLTPSYLLKKNESNKIKNSYLFEPYTTSTLKDDLEKVSIYHISYPFRDINSQSAIVLFRLPDLKMNVFCTGDAHEETLQLISHTKPFIDKNLINVVMLPHHGSFENKSINLFNLFKPDILGISAGNGGTFSHPSRKLVKELEGGLKEIQWATKFYDSFDDFGFGNNFVYFEDVEQKKKGKKGKKEEKKIIRQSRLHKHKKFDKDDFIKTPFFCTNVHGSIKIDTEGFKGIFSSIVEDDYAEEFLVDYTRRVEDESILKGLKNNKTKNNILKQANKYYYRVNAEKNIKYFYEANLANELIEEDSQDNEEN